MKWLSVLVAASLGSAASVGCASSVPPPNDQWDAAQADVGRAQAGGAPMVPVAKLHLQLAVEDLQKSKQMMNDDNKQANSLAVLARTEAQLAFSLAKQAAAQDEVLKAQADLQKTTSPAVR